MVSFSCEGCGDVLTKKKLDAHKNQCHGASFTCLDCMIHFQGTEYRTHTSCISEAQKYQGALYKPEKEKKAKKPQKAYVEDVDDDYTGTISIVNPPPEAPSPPSAAPGFREMSSEPVNVFDFLVGSETPNQSTLNLAAMEKERIRQEDTPIVPSNADLHMVRFQDEVTYDDDEPQGYLIEYGSDPVPTAAFQTPAPKAERESRKKDRDSSAADKKDKKRKRLHVDVSQERTLEGDEVMTDAPPVLHSGLTGGLNRLLARPSIFPPSPDYSGGDGVDASPGSPLKRSKHTKSSKRNSAAPRGDLISNSIMAMISTKKHKKKDSDRVRKSAKRQKDSNAAAQRLIEYKPMNDEEGGESQMVLYRQEARAELLLSLVNKGPESERGCSMNKTLKRYHRERVTLGLGGGKGDAEKELWRSLRLKRNDRGEVVVFF